MKSETTAIQVLSMSALVLLLALIFLPGGRAGAEVSVGNQDFLAVTAQGANGDALYICDTREQVVLVMAWNPAARALELKAVKKLKD